MNADRSTRARRPVNVYLEGAMRLQFEDLRANLAAQGLRLSQTQLGEIAIRHLVSRYENKVEQLVLDLGVSTESGRKI